MHLLQSTANKLNKSIKSNPASFTNLLTIIFSCLGLIGILNHSMWRDEVNVWLITRDSNSWLDLFKNIKYEGHPVLWYVCLYLLNKITYNPVIMQVFHIVLATGFVYIFLRYSPFKKAQKILFIFGYFPFSEYLIISRNYAIGILLLFGFCALYPTRKKSYLSLSIILFFLANSNAYCLFISIALGVTLVVEYSLGERITKSLTASRGNALCSLIIFFLGIVTSLMLLIPPADSTLQGGLTRWMLRLDVKHLAKALTRIWNGYIMILIPSDRYLDLVIFALISLFLVAFVSTLLIRKPIPLFLYLFGTLEIITFTYVKFLGAPRHYGHFYLLLIVSLWISSYYSNSNLLIQPLANIPKRLQKAITSWMQFVKKQKTTFIMVILSAQLVGGMFGFLRDLVIPYSASREAASFIKSQQLDQMFIVGSRDANVSPIGGYLNKKFYYPEKKGMGSFVLFNKQRKDVDHVAVLEQVSQLIKSKKHILLILNSELTTSRNDLNVSLLAKFTRSFIANESYYLYRVNSSK
jgi:hypothetical protein